MAGPALPDVEAGTRFETLLAEISSRFVNLPPEGVDSEIEGALRRVCEHLGIELAVLWQWPRLTQGVATPTHAYQAQAGLLPREPLSEEQFPWARRELLAGRVVSIPSLDTMPVDAAVDRESLSRLGVRASLVVPLAVGGEPPVGVVSFNTIRAPHQWPDEVVTRLQLVGEVFANALARQRHDVSLKEREARLSAGADLAELAFYEVDYVNGTMYTDDRFLELCGLHPDRYQGLEPMTFWIDHLHPDDRSRVMDEREQLHSGRLERLSLEYRYLHPIRGERWVHHAARIAARDATRRVTRSYGVLRDITARKEAEEALQRSYAEIEHLKDRLQAETDYLKAEVGVVLAHDELIGQSAAMANVLRQAHQVAPTDCSVLIQGETGTGKELVAQAIHRLSPRKHRVMIKVNCAALPSGLVESELFGREKGAYTGALTRQVGRFEMADGSTIFLDEVGELPPDVQVKLLRVLQEGEFERLGSPRTVKVDVRVIAATNRNLAEEVRNGRFREDLYYRLNVFPIHVPPLRERPDDIPLLVWAFLKDFSARMGKKITTVPRATMEALVGRAWPGNVRELRNVIEHGTIITSGDALRLSRLNGGGAVTAPTQVLAEVERAHIVRVLESTGWHIKGPGGAAVVLGLHPATLYSRMKKLGIRQPGRCPSPHGQDTVH